MEVLRKFEHDAIAAIGSSDVQCETVLDQLAHALCKSRDYSGVGLFTELFVPVGTPKLDEALWNENMPSCHGEHPDVPAGIDFMLWVTNGYISCLESSTYDGDWPQDESLIRVAT